MTKQLYIVKSKHKYQLIQMHKMLAVYDLYTMNQLFWETMVNKRCMGNKVYYFSYKEQHL